MDLTLPDELVQEMDGFRSFLSEQIRPNLAKWYKSGEIPLELFQTFGEAGWYGIRWEADRLVKTSALREALVLEELAKLSPGIAVAILAHVNLGMTGLFLFGSEQLKQTYGPSAGIGKTVMCVGNSENMAGSDVAGIAMRARKVDGGWQLNGTKAWVTSGYAAELAVITAVSDPDASRNSRISMFLVNQNAEGVRRKKLNKMVWNPSDLTRITLDNVFVPDDHLLGDRGRGLQQVLEIFTNSRVPISALTLGTAVGAFEQALERARKRNVFGKRIIDFQAKAFEFADYYARMEAARLVLLKACAAVDAGRDFRQESSLAKYLTVQIAREITPWAADMFGAVSVMYDHPIHKYPMDAWGASLGEGTQDVQKLVIFRELLKQYPQS